MEKFVTLKIPASFFETAATKIEEAAEILETLEVLSDNELMKMLKEAELAGEEEFVEV